MFWYYTALTRQHIHKELSTGVRQPTHNTSKIVSVGVWSVVAIIIDIISLLFELRFIPRKWTGAQPVSKRLALLILALILNVAQVSTCLCLSH